MKIEVEVSGGLELLLEGKRNISLEFNEKSLPLSQLISYIKNNCIKERPDLFYNDKDGSVRPGILVLINDVDWELEGGLEYQVKDKDKIAFISTLHGG